MQHKNHPQDSSFEDRNKLTNQEIKNYTKIAAIRLFMKDRQILQAALIFQWDDDLHTINHSYYLLQLVAIAGFAPILLVEHLLVGYLEGINKRPTAEVLRGFDG
jgi:hypothetical protein